MRVPFSRKLLGIFFLDYRFFVKKNPTLDVCPNCNSFASLERLFQSGRLHKIPRVFGFKKFHCLNCKWDGYIYLYVPANDIKKIMRNYIIALIALIIFYYLLLYFFGDIYNAIYN